MNRQVLRVVWYRFRLTFRQRWRGHLALVLLIGVLGGLAMGSAAAARRTASSYPRFLASTHPSDLIVQPSTTFTTADLAAFIAEVAALPHVARVGTAISFKAATLTPNGSIGTLLLTQAELVGTTDGLYTDQDRVTILKGRAAVPSRAGEVVVSPSAASLLRLDVGSHLTLGLDSNNQQDYSHQYRTIGVTVVGLGLWNTQVVQDDIDRGRTGLILATPALASAFRDCCSDVNYLNLRLTGGSRDDAAVEAEYAHLVATSRYTGASHSQLLYYITSSIEADAQRAIRPEAVALGVFGVIAAFIALLIGIQAVSRQLGARAEEVEVLRALGASPGVTWADGLPGTIGAVVIGSILAAAGAVGLSAIARFGPVRHLDPAPRIDFDWTVLGFGVLVLVVALGTGAAALAYVRAPHRTVARGRVGERRSRAVGAPLATGLPVAAVAGVRFAVDPGEGRHRAPVRSAILGAVLAVAVVMATLIFSASLDHLVSHPALYGWNFDAALYSTDGFGPIPTTLTEPLLARDRNIAATTGVYFGSFAIDGQAVPGIAAPTRPAVAPVVLSGHGLDHRDDVVLGPGTLTRLHKHLGDSVTLEGNGQPATRLRIAGTAALPAIGQTAGVHASTSTGALFSTDVVPPDQLQNYGPDSGPNAIFVRFRAGVARAAGLRSLGAIAAQLTQVFHSPEAVAATGGGSLGANVEALSVQRPAEIVNYRSMGAVPELLAGALASGAVVALVLTLVASVRRRRREFAMLKTLGFTTRQVSTAVASQATVIAVVGLVAGVPLGVALGRWLWVLFARALAVVPHPIVPADSIALAALAAVALANIVAAIPARSAGRTSVALLLRAE